MAEAAGEVATLHRRSGSASGAAAREEGTRADRLLLLFGARKAASLRSSSACIPRRLFVVCKGGTRQESGK